jgi:hypothetical protein
MHQQYDIARLAQLRDKHTELRARYGRSMEAVQQAAAEVAAARRETPQRVVKLKVPKHAFAEGIRHNDVPDTFTHHDEAYMAPVDDLRTHTAADLNRLQMNAPAVRRIIAAADRLQRLRNEQHRLSDEVAVSCAFMARIENFAKANRL